MREGSQDRQRRPLRDTVCDIDKDILRLMLRRTTLIAKMSGAKNHLAPQEEKYLREAWETQASKVSNDPRLTVRMFSLMQEIEFLPKPTDDGECRQAFGLLPARQPVDISLQAPLSCRLTRCWIALAAASGQPMRLEHALMNDPVIDCVKMFNQMGAAINREGDGITASSALPSQTPDKVIHLGDDPFNFYLSLGQYLGRPSRAKFIGGPQLRLDSLAAVRKFVPTLGARIVHIIPKSEGLPVRVESSGILPDMVELTADLPVDFIIGLLLAAPFYERQMSFSLGSHPDSEKILSLILPLLDETGASYSVESENLHIMPSTLLIPQTPKVPMEPDLAASMLLLGAALKGSVTLSGSWNDEHSASALLDLFGQSGLSCSLNDEGLSLSADKRAVVPAGGLELPEGLPASWLPVAMALTCISALVTGSSRMPKSYTAGNEAWTTAESFVRSCGLDLAPDGTISLPEEAQGPAPVLTAASPLWAAALSAAAGARRQAAQGFRLANPAVMTELYPSWWPIYNSLPTPTIAQKEPEQPKTRRRIMTASPAQLTPKDDDEF